MHSGAEGTQLRTSNTWKRLEQKNPESTDSRKITTSQEPPALVRTCTTCGKTTEGWGRVTEANGTTGYVCGKYCQEAFTKKKTWQVNQDQGQ